jgi:hypothetical protein
MCTWMWHYVACVKVAHGRWTFVHDGPRILPSSSAQIHIRGSRGRGCPVDADGPWTRTQSGRGRCPRGQYMRSIISGQVVADCSLYSASSDRRDMDLDAVRTWTARGQSGRPQKIADVDMPRTQCTRHGHGLAVSDAGISSMGFFGMCTLCTSKRACLCFCVCMWRIASWYLVGMMMCRLRVRVACVAFVTTCACAMRT